ncbi:hypothetical protein GCK72_008093 [Caenorhabditis remanei]|uniref:Uncharacterized protein n=1 Tax=Caenorhabditis remanei TaxID=31234 RepID=A0A6A5HLW3_CAERE|nr:hypothetical protein GCK72_008093 [Caenorhabditis remanei]KAF1768131.1 hypothetical protein GCK72_008093 [Caenorhabditis remanei]
MFSWLSSKSSSSGPPATNDMKKVDQLVRKIEMYFDRQHDRLTYPTDRELTNRKQYLTDRISTLDWKQVEIVQDLIFILDSKETRYASMPIQKKTFKKPSYSNCNDEDVLYSDVKKNFARPSPTKLSTLPFGYTSPLYNSNFSSQNTNSKYVPTVGCYNSSIPKRASSPISDDSPLFSFDLPLKPSNELAEFNQKENILRKYDHEHSQKQFEQELKSLELKSRENKLEMDKNAEEREKLEISEFNEKRNKQKEEHEKEIKKRKREMENFQRETKRLQDEYKSEWRANTSVFIDCVLMKQKFEEKEEEWAIWLKTLRKAVDNSRLRFAIFESNIEILDTGVEDYDGLLINELNYLYSSTLSVYDVAYDHWATVKQLFNRFPEKVFLGILCNNLVDTCNRIYTVLIQIDNYKINKASLYHVQQAFISLNNMEIPNTTQLREQAQRENSYSLKTGKDPLVYERKSTVKIEEMS